MEDSYRVMASQHLSPAQRVRVSESIKSYSYVCCVSPEYHMLSFVVEHIFVCSSCHMMFTMLLLQLCLILKLPTILHPMRFDRVCAVIALSWSSSNIVILKSSST